MSQIKRSLSFNQSSNKKTKKLQNKPNRLIISIENLSDELFYEIFEYLDGGEIHQAFSNLNHRFQQLLNSSSLLLKLQLQYTPAGKTLMNNYQPIGVNRHQIFSIYSWKPSIGSYFFSSFTAGLSPDRLESLVLETVDPSVLISILDKLKFLPRLFSLTIMHSNDLIDLTDIYRIILSLPVLKYYKFMTNKPYLSVLLSMATNEQFNTIEHLVIDHHCTFEELSMITSYTPELRRLCFMNEVESDDLKTEIILPINLSNLTHLSIRDYYKKFDEFEMFISKLHSKLKVLSFTTQSLNIAYLDSYRWEEFILKYLPQLEKFCLQYCERIDNKYKYPIYSGGPNQFFSSFWIERQWIMEAEIAGEYITHVVRPYRKRWHEYIPDKMIYSSAGFCKSTQLTFTYISSDAHDELINIHCRRVLSAAQIYHLEISDEKTFIGTLIQIIKLLPKLDSLKIRSLSFDQPKSLSAEELAILCSIANICKITKVYLEKMVGIGEVYLLMTLCPYMLYPKVGFINNINVELFLRNILEKINHERNNYLRSLCFHIPTAEDKMIKKLEKMINIEKLLLDFIIERVLDNIYLKWT
ncbi:unnamed protein product [Rotaria sp. Silwood1]|nr:unnamed protein product [Rotaria sp. Silwood1]